MALMDNTTMSRTLSKEVGSVATQQLSAGTVRRRLHPHGLPTR